MLLDPILGFSITQSNLGSVSLLQTVQTGFGLLFILILVRKIKGQHFESLRTFLALCVTEISILLGKQTILDYNVPEILIWFQYIDGTWYFYFK